jgi:uncharacterized protein YabN with tetrapyrrole methylase and pyrophosphatase domain
VGFDWPSVENVYDKISEEIDEFRTAPAEKKAEEFGDLLFALANVARHLSIDPESALRSAADKFQRRFAHIEQRLADAKTPLAEAGLDRMEQYWNEAKALGK